MAITRIASHLCEPVGYRNDHIMVDTTDISGQARIDVRLWYTDGNTGELKPSPKGVAMPFDTARRAALAILEAVGPE